MTTPITSPSLLASYLAQDGAFRGIGPKRAQALWDVYGCNVLDALREPSPEVIAIVGEEPALCAAAVLEVRHDESRMVEWLTSQQVVLPAGQLLHLARAWGSVGLEAVQENPYLLLAVAPWRIVDALAQRLGVSHQDTRRLVGAVEAILQGDDGLLGGHTVVPTELLLDSASRLLGFSIDAAGLDACVAAGGAVSTPSGYQPPGAAWMEEEVAETLLQLAQEPSAYFSASSSSGQVARPPAHFPFALTDAQRQAVSLSQERRLFVLGGYAGSGKTTVLRSVCDALEARGQTPILITLSGRAAQRARDATGRRSMTVAKFLILHDRDEAFLRSDHVVIVDEASMLSLPDVWRILRRIGNASLILAGDPAQLAPIGFGLVFHTLFDVPEIPSVVLDRVVRQSEESGIPTFASEVRSGRLPKLLPLEQDLKGISFVPCSREELLQTLDDIFAHLDSCGISRLDTQIAAPTRREIAAINAHFHGQALRDGHPSWGSGRRFCEGEPLIWTQNMPDRDLTNGSMGHLVSAAGQGETILDGQNVSLSPQDATFLELAHAISVHKAQGSQWPCVIVPVFSSRILDRSLIYTALTRAQQHVILVGEIQALRCSVCMNLASERRTNLRRQILVSTRKASYIKKSKEKVLYD